MAQITIGNIAEAMVAFNEAHGITGLQVGKQTVTNDMIRTLKHADAPSMQHVVDVLAAQEAVFKRPKGRAEYTIKGWEWRHGYQRFVLFTIIVWSSLKQGETTISWQDLKRMDRVR